MSSQIQQQLHNQPQNERINEPATEGSSQILTGRKLYLVFTALLLSMLLTALDQTILSTALPRIASEFNAFSLQGWVSSSFILAQTIFLLFYGQLLRICSAKYIMLASITIFEIGSLVSALAPNVHQLIVGRTVSGVGGAGICELINRLWHGEYTDRRSQSPQSCRLYLKSPISKTAPVFLACSVPSLAFHPSWDPSWIFFLNLPIGGVSLVAVIFLLKAQPPLGADLSRRTPRDILSQFLRMDFVGAVLIAGAVTSLVLALQWGGNTKAWGDSAVIICFIVAFVLAIALVFWEMHLKDRALVPTSIFHSRSVYAIILYAFLTRFTLLLFAYYIPIFYQAVRHRTATNSAVHLLPFLFGAILSAIASGQIASMTGYYFPFLVGAPFFLAIGSGLLYTLNTTTPVSRIIGFQILAGIGTGLGMQNSLVAMQAEFKDTPRLLGQATSMAAFGQFFGGTMGLGVAEPVFSSQLTKYLRKYAPEAPASVVRESPTNIYTELPQEMIPGVVRSYTEALRVVFVVGVPVAGLALIASLFIKNIRITKEVVERPLELEKTEA
ncbi:major facilitator superfamily domain-containing protein [Roridomyces roridus]|uniref:Major facilitator superfamily domain-containing protein n=1 Tax=Roridomyces roridus TaxID=1738132 RepID=A0AAD7BLY9_9AGAR|nr:major facilitator superfamily domain-containing protein [Roridomyces roridus]